MDISADSDRGFDSDGVGLCPEDIFGNFAELLYVVLLYFLFFFERLDDLICNFPRTHLSINNQFKYKIF